MAIIYSIKYSDQTSDPVNKKPFTIAPGAMDTTTSLVLPGQAAALYGEHIAENFLHMLENFASATSPANPTVGQLWYDSVLKQVRVLTAITTNGAGVKSYTWSPVSGPYISTTPPSNNGTLWYDTSNANPDLWQLKVYNTGKSAWVSVAEQYVRKSGDAITGSITTVAEAVGLTSGTGTHGFYPAAAASGTTLAARGNATVMFNTAGGTGASFNVSNSTTFAGSIVDAALLFQVASTGIVSIRKGVLNMNANKITNLAAGTATTDGVNYGQLADINTTLSGLISGLQNSKVNRVGDTMTGALTITAVGIGTGTGTSAGEGRYSLVVNGTGSDSGGILIRAQDDNNDENGLEIVNNYGAGGATQTTFAVKSFTGDTTIAGNTALAKNLTVGGTLFVTGVSTLTGIATMNVAATAIVNARHLTTKEYVDAKVASVATTDTYARVNPTTPRNGDILINGALTYIYNSGWKVVSPSQWAD